MPDAQGGIEKAVHLKDLWHKTKETLYVHNGSNDALDLTPIRGQVEVVEGTVFADARPFWVNRARDSPISSVYINDLCSRPRRACPASGHTLAVSDACMREGQVEGCGLGCGVKGLEYHRF